MLKSQPELAAAPPPRPGRHARWDTPAPGIHVLTAPCSLARLRLPAPRRDCCSPMRLASAQVPALRSSEARPAAERAGLASPHPWA